MQSYLKPQASVDSWFSILWSYMSIAFANVFFQGLLDIHTLLDDPYGDHCCKFPIKSEVAELLCATRSLLCCGDLPLMFSDIFECRAPLSAEPAAGLQGVRLCVGVYAVCY
jgi:hypothetical protein